MQYTRNDIDLTQGTYRVRGDVIDIFPAESEREAVRVELFDDEHRFARAVRSADRRGLAQGAALHRLSGHALRDAARAAASARSTRSARTCASGCSELREAGKLRRGAAAASSARMFDLEMIQEVGYCAGIENYSRYLSGRAPGEPPPCLFDYLPKQCAAGRRREPPDAFRSSAPCTRATARARKRWWSTASACPRRSTTGR